MTNCTDAKTTLCVTDSFHLMVVVMGILFPASDNGQGNKILNLKKRLNTQVSQLDPYNADSKTANSI